MAPKVTTEEMGADFEFYDAFDPTTRELWEESISKWTERSRSSSATIWVCRDIPGDHIGGQECFCIPTPIDAWDEYWEDKLEMAEKAN